MTVTAIVLAGGRSTRFGPEKLHAEVGGVTLLELAVEAVRQVATQVIVAGPEPTAGGAADRIESEIRFVADESPFDGPLAALANVLPTVESEFAVVVGGDMPSLVPAVLEAMIAKLRSELDIDAVTLAATGPKRQVLPLALRVKPAAIAAAAVAKSGNRSLQRLVSGLRSGEFPASEWRTVDPRGVTLLDVDEPADLERVQKELR